jgi:hypothetical protein
MLCTFYDSVVPDPIVSHVVRVLPGVQPLEWVSFSDVRSLAIKIQIPGHIYLTRIVNHIDID